MRRGTGLLLLALLLAGSGGPVPPASARTRGVIRLQTGEVLLPSLVEPNIYEVASVHDLGLVNPKAKQSLLGVRIGALGRTYGLQKPRNRLFYKNSRIACASFVSYVMRKAGWKHGSASATGLYGLARRYGGRVVATRVNTRLTRFFPAYKAGDLVFFHKGRRFGHVEIYLGGGLTAGTSSSKGRVGIRGIGNRGYRLMTILRM